jgi:hypothetical protein
MTSLLFTLAGDPDAEYIAGDLREEFDLMRAEHGSGSAVRWYAWQLVRSLARPLARRLLGVMIVLVLPIAMLDRAWLLVFDQLCLLPADGLLLVNSAGWCAGALFTRRRARISILVALSAGAGLASGPAAFPQVFAGLLAVSAGILAMRIRKAIG